MNRTRYPLSWRDRLRFRFGLRLFTNTNNDGPTFRWHISAGEAAILVVFILYWIAEKG